MTTKIERDLLTATFKKIDTERELGEACERPVDKPGFLDEGYDEWRSTPEYAALSAKEQEVRLRVYAVDEEWRVAADSYYEACFAGAASAGNRDSATPSGLQESHRG